MHVRPMTRDDIPLIADIATAAFREDELFSIFYPPAALKSGAFRRSNLLRLRKRFVAVGSRALVAESDDTDKFWSGRSQLLGYCFWSRVGKSEEARKWQTDSLVIKLERALVTTEMWYAENLVDRDRDWRKIQQFNRLAVDNFGSIPEYLELAVLGVDPKYHRRGVGGTLAQWGVDMARSEHIPIVVEGSKAGTGLYTKLGFDTVSDNEIVDGIHVVAMKLEPASA